MLGNLASIHFSTNNTELRIQLFSLHSHSSLIPVEYNIQDDHAIAWSNMSAVVLEIQGKEVFKNKEKVNKGENGDVFAAEKSKDRKT